MPIRFSEWTKWSERDHLTGIDSSGVYLIAEGRGIKGRPSVRDLTEKVIYIGCTPQRPLRPRLELFDKACKGENFPNHPAGRLYFGHRIYPEFWDEVEQVHEEHNLRKIKAIRRVYQRGEYLERLQEFENLWNERQKQVKLAIWVPTRSWDEKYPELSKALRIRLAEVKVQIRFVEQHQHLPKYNRTFG